MDTQNTENIQNELIIDMREPSKERLAKRRKQAYILMKTGLVTTAAGLAAKALLGLSAAALMGTAALLAGLLLKRTCGGD